MKRGHSLFPHAPGTAARESTEPRLGRAARRRLAQLVTLLTLVSGGVLTRSFTRAEEATPALLAPDALDGGRYVGSALARARSSLRLTASLGYGFTEAVLAANDRHHRLAGELAAAWVAVPWFQVSVAGQLRFDRHAESGPGSETGWLGSTRIATRHAFAVTRRLALALSPSAHFPGADSARRGLQAASYNLVALASYALPADLSLSLALGYRVDRSRYAFKDAELLVPSQRLAAATSQDDAYLVGTLLSLPLSSFRLAFEWSWDIMRGGDVKAHQSPMRVRLAAQRVLGERWLPGVELGVDTSARPELVGLVRIEPRVWARVTLGFWLEEPARPRPPAAPSAVVASDRTLEIHVVDPQGEPIAGATITLSNQHPPHKYGSDALGRASLSTPPGSLVVGVEAEGYEPASKSIGPHERGTQRITLSPDLPAAEIKGAVRNLSGDPLRARVELLPLGLTVDTDDDGQFAIGVVPGDYTLRILAAGYEPQERPAQVELRGVTIVVIDLKKAQP